MELDILLKLVAGMFSVVARLAQVKIHVYVSVYEQPLRYKKLSKLRLLHLPENL